ncbi:HelD family protein [Virgisporangium ochraceum]|uniref:DNA helicase n=1 Tax=Virgisporangium ochraceum TaxID=65505 RepID=A0A8J4A0Y1_9ACTN|nr:ATP-binding domain-containing protein [Virgisporangium ochraceum]GIJ71120.1 DNA helicase [Virgisporangium ochraceum]
MEQEQEQAYLDRTRRALAWMLDHARMRVATGDRVAGDRYTAEVLGRMLKSYAKELAEEPDSPLYFGQLRFGTGAGSGAGDHSGQSYHIGRRRITDEAGETLVIDWRAPVSARFYRASARDRMGVSVRRRFGWSPRPPVRLTGFEDEHLDRGEETGIGSALLKREIERPRVGPMRDIIATIQPEQDELVRADVADSLCVQGGPGTGKTAVGLHRAAYLLYAHRGQLRRTGVLVVGPNPTFLGHIAAVLPALGEIDVRQHTLDEVLTAREPSTVDSAEAAAVKHDERMAGVLRRALYARVGGPAAPVVVYDGSYVLRVSSGAVAREVRTVLAADLPYLTGRERLRARIVALLQRQLEARGESPNASVLQWLGRRRTVTEALDAAWPKVKPEEVLHAVLSDPTDDALTAAQRQAIRWAKPPRSVRSARWSAADLVLHDEVAGLLDHPDEVGHLVVDEAQDLSPMQCRALARRSRHGSITVLGDLAQGTTPWAATDWPAQLAHLGKPAAPVVGLTTGFRVPAAVLAFANRLLPALGVEVPTVHSVRSDGTLRVRRATDLARATLTCVTSALDHDGSIAVVATAPRLDAVMAAIGDRVSATAATRVTAVPAALAKGLEFDHVVVVEPAEILEAQPRGANRLYVALTRAVSRLDVVHSRPLPDALNS